MIEQIKIAVTLIDGSVVVRAITTNNHNDIMFEPTIENINAHNIKYPFEKPFISWRFIEDSEILSIGREYRNAWEDNKGKLTHNLQKAKDCHKEKLRMERGLIFEKLDAEFMMALEQNDSKTIEKIAKRKQELRDITIHPDIEKAKNIEELKKLSITNLLDNV